MATRERLKKRVGRSVAKKPETLIEEVMEMPVVIPADGEPYVDDMGVTVDPAEEAAWKLRRAQENEWDSVKVKWAEQTRIQVMTEFIRDKGLFLELAKYAKKRTR